METNKVNVKIYGQEYTIAGEKSREQIIKVADYVDGKMAEISKKRSNGPIVSLAVLAAVNIADDYFEEMRHHVELENEMGRLRKDVHHFEQLWEETKKSFSHFKEELNQAAEKNQELKRLLAEKTKQADAVENQDKYKELESNYFDLQMENIRLKGELEKGKR